MVITLRTVSKALKVHTPNQTNCKANLADEENEAAGQVLSLYEPGNVSVFYIDAELDCQQRHDRHGLVLLKSYP